VYVLLVQEDIENRPSGAIQLTHTYSVAVTTLSDTARTYSVYSGPRGGVAA